MRVEAIMPVDQMSEGLPWPAIFDDFGGNVAERAGERGGSLVWRVGEFISVER